MIWSRRRTAPGGMGTSSLTGEGNIHRESPVSRYARRTSTTPGGRTSLRMEARVFGTPTWSCAPAQTGAQLQAKQFGITFRLGLDGKPLELLRRQHLHHPAPLGRQLTACSVQMSRPPVFIRA